MADPKTGDIDWEALKVAASVTESRYNDDIGYLCTLAQKFGGGASGRFIRKLSEFVTAAVPDNRRLPSKFWAALAELRVDVSSLCPFVIWGIVKEEAKTTRYSCVRRCDWLHQPR